MTNYNNFNSRDYSCGNCRDNYTPSYNGVLNLGSHGSYSSEQDSSQ